MRFLTSALALLLLLATPSTASSGLKTKWTNAGSGLGLGEGTTFASNGEDMVVISNSSGAIFAFKASDGSMLWEVLPMQGHSLSKLEMRPGVSTVFALWTKDQKESGSGGSVGFGDQSLFVGMNGTSGGTLFSVKLSFESSLHYGTKNLVILDNKFERPDHPEVVSSDRLRFRLHMYNYDLQTGALVWEMEPTAVEKSQGGAVGQDVFLLEYVDPRHGPYFLSLDLQTGHALCNFSHYDNLGATAIVGNVVVGTKPGTMRTQWAALYDANSDTNGECAYITTIGGAPRRGHADHVYTDKSHFYFFNWSMKVLDQYETSGEKGWSRQLHGDFMKLPEISDAVFNDKAFIVADAGHFFALNKTSGGILWNISTPIPYSKGAQPTHPLGHSSLFVPNLQGWIVIDPLTGHLFERNEFTPLTQAASFMGTSKPFVVFGDLKAGALRAVELA